MRTLVAIVALLLVSRVTLAQDAPPAPSLPWDVAACRSACELGLSLTYDRDTDGKRGAPLRIGLADDGEGGLTLLEGEPDSKEEPKPTLRTWEQHLAALVQPFANGNVSDEELTLMGRKLACKRLSAPGDKGSGVLRISAWFCAEIAGYWVKQTIEREGSTQTLTLSATDTLYHDIGYRPSAIARALREGARLLYRYTDEHGEASRFAMTIEDGNDEGYREVLTYYDAAGKPEGDPVRARRLWARHARGFLFPKAQYTLTTAEMEFGGEKLACVLLTLSETREDATRVVITTVSKRLPGVIVARHTTFTKGQIKLKTRVELLEFKIGK